MRKDYKLKYHLRNYIKQELYDYNRNKKILKDIQKKLGKIKPNSQLKDTSYTY